MSIAVHVHPEPSGVIANFAVAANPGDPPVVWIKFSTEGSEASVFLDHPTARALRLALDRADRLLGPEPEHPTEPESIEDRTETASDGMEF